MSVITKSGHEIMKAKMKEEHLWDNMIFHWFVEENLEHLFTETSTYMKSSMDFISNILKVNHDYYKCSVFEENIIPISNEIIFHRLKSNEDATKTLMTFNYVFESNKDNSKKKVSKKKDKGGITFEQIIGNKDEPRSSRSKVRKEITQPSLTTFCREIHDEFKRRYKVDVECKNKKKQGNKRLNSKSSKTGHAKSVKIGSDVDANTKNSKRKASTTTAKTISKTRKRKHITTTKKMFVSLPNQSQLQRWLRFYMKNLEFVSSTTKRIRTVSLLVHFKMKSLKRILLS